MAIFFPNGTQIDIPAQQTQGHLLKTARAAQRVQQSIPHSIDPRGKQGAYNPPPFPGVIMARTNSSISPCNGSSGSNTATPGTGTVDLFYMGDDPSSGSALRDNSTTNVAIVNWYVNNGNGINAGINCLVVQCGQNLVLLGADCTN